MSLLGALLPDRALPNVTVHRATLGGKVRDVGDPRPVVEIMNLDIPPLPGLHPVLDLSHPVGEPDVQDPVVSLNTRDGALTVPNQHNFSGENLHTGQQRVYQPG